jgi:hypothetical protein
MRVAATRLAANSSHRGFGDQLYDLSGQRPSLDLNFSNTKSLTDSASGQQLVTFTRASSGTFVGSDGLIKTATTNLLLRSEDFETTWSNINSSESINTAIAPNGQLTGDKLISDNGAALGDSAITQTISKAAVSTTYAFSIYAKAAELNRATLYVRDSASSSNRATATFSLVNGQITSSAAAFGTFSAASAPAGQNAGDGWYRISLAFTTSTETGLAVRIYTGDSSLTTGDGTSGIYIWGAQLEQSSTVGEYIPTTSTINSAPRFDHNPTTGESLGLLVEEQRTNLLVRSEEFDNASWTVATATITANTGTSPAGTTTVDTVASTGTSVVSQSITKAASVTTYSASLFVKGTVNALSLTIDDGATVNRGRVVFNLSTGAISSTNNDGDFTGTSGTITSYANSWYRIAVTTTSNSATSARLRFFWTGSGTSIDAWGAQLEAGAFPTSYIPTTTATVTRSADVASISGSNFSGWFNASEGSIYTDNSNTSRVWACLSDGTTSNRLDVRGSSATTAVARTVISGSESWAISRTVSLTGGGYIKTATAIGASDAFVVDGGAVGTAAGNDAAVNQLRIGARVDGVDPVSGTIRRLTYWPSRLPNTTLQQITQ